MPFDGSPKDFETVTKPDVFSLDIYGLAAWLRTMPPNQEYDYNDCRGQCLFGQFYAACGLPWFMEGVSRYRASEDDDLHVTIAVPHPRTFGAALLRTERAIQERKG